MSVTMIRCPECGAEVFDHTAGLATSRWREHVIAVHVHEGQEQA